MHILCDISHPAHVHFFRNAIDIWRERGHRVSIMARDKDITLELLDEYGYEYHCLSRARRGLLGLGLELFEHEGRLYKKFWREPPDVLLEIGGTLIVHAAKMLRRPAIVFYDTEHARMSNAITYPFASVVCTPACYEGDIGAKHIRYQGYHELAYLHPNRFEPDSAILAEAGLRPGDPYFIVRFVSWDASHDVAQKGFSLEGKKKLVRELERYGRVIVSSEGKLPPELEPFQMKLAPTKVHHLLAFATLYVGESATMASEAALLGTPSIYVNPLSLGYLEDQERYGLVYRILDENETIKRAVALVTRPNIRREWQDKRERLVRDKIDVTAWIVDWVEAYTLTGQS